MQAVLLWKDMAQVADKMDASVFQYIGEHQTESFESFKNYDLMAFDWYDVHKAGKSGKVLVYIDREDLFFFCRDEAAQQYVHGTVQELTAAARELLQTGVQKVIVSMGSRGMLHVLPEQTIFVPGLRVPVKDTVGAGDAVIAALAVAEERGLTLEETLRLSTAAGAASVMCTGTQAASLETIQQLMEQVTYREL